MRARTLTEHDEQAWAEFVESCPQATLFHRLPWRRVIHDVFGHRPEYLLAENEQGVQGVMPLFILKTRFFGTIAISMPFLNYGGVAANDDRAAAVLLAEAEQVGRRRGCQYVELRHRYPVSAAAKMPTNKFKVTGVLDLGEGAEAIWQSKLHQNVRNKIRKAEKAEARVEFGHQSLDEFYQVFLANQRDHGTPTLPKRWFVRVLQAFPDRARLYLVRREGRAIGAKFVIDSGDTCYFIWSSSYHSENRYAPVPAMNWAAIQAAAARGLAWIDMGRSTVGSGGEHFKKYWGVQNEPLFWQYHLLTGEEMPGLNPTNPKFDLAIRAWRRLPVGVTRLLGPFLARDLP